MKCRKQRKYVFTFVHFLQSRISYIQIYFSPSIFKYIVIYINALVSPSAYVRVCMLHVCTYVHLYVCFVSIKGRIFTIENISCIEKMQYTSELLIFYFLQEVKGKSNQHTIMF